MASEGGGWRRRDTSQHTTHSPTNTTPGGAASTVKGQRFIVSHNCTCACRPGLLGPVRLSLVLAASVDHDLLKYLKIASKLKRTQLEYTVY